MKNPKFHPENDAALSPGSRATLADLVDAPEHPRRSFLKGTGATAMAVLLGAGLSNRANAYPAAPAAAGGLGFGSVPANVVPMADRCTVPAGYTVRVLAAWGDPVSGGPQYNPNQPQTEANQLQQYGMHVDGMEFFPFAARGGPSNDRGLIAVNHEYTDQLLLWNLASAPASVTLEQVRASQAAHGVSVIETRRVGGTWQVVRPSVYGRRITGNTPCTISGPAAGADLMKTAADPTGREVLGTLNNCAHGSTPWGTYLTCEENWNGYFGANGSFTPNALERRYGLAAGGFGYRWHEVDPRFDLNAAGNRNEPNRFGWVVEIDPFDPRHKPVKRTALGRFKHESAMSVVGPDNTFAIYSGDDERNDYLYKFVASAKYDPSNRAANRNLLDAGTLYVAKFAADGTGTWIPLVHGQNGLTAANGFANQAEVLIKTRQAADRVDATEMDRPEWIAAHPVTREMYLALTNNNRRGTSPASVNATDGSTTAGGARPPVDASNPRVDNRYGHIVRWRESGDDPGATTFEWDIYVLAGDRLRTASPNLVGNIVGDDFGAPDGLWFDRDGRLWIQTDQQGDATGDWTNIGGNALLASDPSTREVRRFMTSPPNCEVTGITGTPDGRTLFVGIQHPGEDWTGSFTQRSAWPDNGLNGPTTLSTGNPVKPRSSTLVITRDDGGRIGAL